ncbi:SDR family NAD(P)-dependent oxidoreductase [Leptolyngbya sp. AN02str]|uniref:SDR family NAD(P)-dependent oxidoreductase n=1 Tax=Leptolyngbya sp. AN02str TaxID=3423363 RepID=UPI003D31094B
MTDFANKTVLVTGASGGIGRATAIAFANAGATVALHYHQRSDAAEHIRAALPGTGHITVQADLTDPAAVEQMVNGAIAHLGYLDILVNNAGIYQEQPIDQTTYADWQALWHATLNTNLLGAVNTAYCTAQHMMTRRQGRIINITSRGAFRGEPNALAYGASKAGLNSFSQSLAQTLAPYGISVMAVAPGFVETDMARSVLEGPNGDVIRHQSPMGRVAKPEEVAYTVLFLANDASEFLTGAIVDVNGASYLRS